MGKIINAQDIPKSLWDMESRKIILPTSLNNAWLNIVTESGLLEKAHKPAPNGIAGGISKEDTDNHLVWKFSGSAARTQLSLLDPDGSLGNVPDAYFKIFSGGTVLIADLPSGSGAATAALLTTIEQLRREEIIPRLPLKVKIVAGEISDFARAHASNLLKKLEKNLNEQAIFLEMEFLKWDALSKKSTAEITKRLILLSQDCGARLILMANFSDFLQNSGRWKEASNNFENLFIHAADSESYVIWIEPKTNEVVKENGFMMKIISWFLKLFNTGDSNFSSCEAFCQHPIRIEHKFRVNLTLKRFDLPNE